MPPAALHYVRFQSTTRHPHGHFPGVFALVNTLAKEGRLTPGQERFRRTNNDWYDANYPNPSDTDPTVYDRTLNPGAVAWFKSTSHDLIARVDGYLAILAAHHIPCHRLHSATPRAASFTRTPTKSSSPPTPPDRPPPPGPRRRQRPPRPRIRSNSPPNQAS
ncbi:MULTISPECIES: hypothetical protein [Streptomyces]|uniref:hypothetical protein n=1 Tax=Streptomyces TaxID=1883 RepID=UPI000A5C4ED6